VADVTVHAGSVWEGLRSGLLSFVYLDQPWRYLSESFARSAVPWLAMGLVALLAWSAFRWAGDADLSGAPLPAGASRRAVGLGVLWAVLGALPPALAGHHFSAYYMSFAAVGFALACGPLLAEARWPVAAGVLLLAPVLNVAANGVDHFRLTTHTDELPGVGYVTIARLGREARFLDSLQVALQRERPPRGAAIYLSHAPKGVSFATAGERAPKVWFDDPTLELTYITRYESGAAGRAARFFRFDEQTQGFVPLPAALVDGIVATEALLAHGRWAEARDHVERTLAYARPGLHELERVELLNDLGMIEWRLGDKPSARVRWTEAAAEAPEHVAVRLNLTVLEADAGRLDSALVHVRDVLSIEPDQPLALLFLARIERQLGHVSDAAATWQRLESENPAFADSVERHDGSY
jgi:tetratricopeptide (TPR) repeat protein